MLANGVINCYSFKTARIKRRKNRKRKRKSKKRKRKRRKRKRKNIICNRRSQETNKEKQGSMIIN